MAPNGKDQEKESPAKPQQGNAQPNAVPGTPSAAGKPESRPVDGAAKSNGGAAEPAKLAKDEKGHTQGDRPESGGGDTQPVRPSGLELLAFVSALMLTFVVLIWVFLRLWPVPGEESLPLVIFAMDFGAVSPVIRYLALVIVGGALGSFIHIATSAGDYIGNRKLFRSWIYWYLLRLPVGASLSLLLYLLLRGSVVPTPGNGEPYGIIGVSALAGMFAKKASNKLGDIFERVFSTGKDELLKDKVGAQPPGLASLDPDRLKAKSSNLTVKVIGQHLQESTQVQVGGEAAHSKWISATRISVQLRPLDVSDERALEFQLETPGISEKSKALTLQVEA